ncbi:hypothetical protein PFISCL1PPCAC_13406, partial [Pristionchus fissidentatus]
TKQGIMRQQRNMFIIVGVCTASNILKGVHQMSWVFIAAFHLSNWSTVVSNLYPYPHYIATYAPSITLVIFSSKIRALLINRDFLCECSLRTSDTYLLLRIKLSANAYFRSPFFYFFVITGACGILSVVGYAMSVRYPISEEFSWVFRVGFILNAVGVTSATIGKFYISLHRYVVMRS